MSPSRANLGQLFEAFPIGTAVLGLKFEEVITKKPVEAESPRNPVIMIGGRMLRRC